MGNTLANDASKLVKVQFVFVIEAGFNARVSAEIYSSNLLLQLEGVQEEVLKLDELYPEKYEYLLEGKQRAQVVNLYQFIHVNSSKPETLFKGECFFINNSTKWVSVKLKDKETPTPNAVITIEIVGFDQAM